MMKLLDHAARAVSRAVVQYKAKPLITGLMRIFGEQAQELENAIWDELTATGITNSFGAQLDGIGRILSFPRDGRLDDIYRLWLKAKVKLDRSSGTVPELLDIFKPLTTGRTLTLVQYFPAAFEFSIGAAATVVAEAHALASILRSGRAAGVRGTLIWLNETPEATFSFANGPGLGFGAGAFASSRS